MDGIFDTIIDDSFLSLSSESSGIWDLVLGGESPQSTASSNEPIPLPHEPILAFVENKMSVERNKISYSRCFGQFGVLPGQFSEPSGIAATNKGELVITDTNNHRVQVYSRDGLFLFQFGERGKLDGQMLFPHRIAVNPNSGDIIIAERASNQLQIFTRTGRFIRKFAGDILQHPRSICIDAYNFIIVVECKIKRIVIFDYHGNVFSSFNCLGQLQFPNSICANDRQELYISDNREHCVKVFTYYGVFKRQIGCPGITNFPVGVTIDSLGQLIVVDNHNCFHVTVFDQEGNFLHGYESTAKHLQCFDTVIMNDHTVAIASKDFRVYVYGFGQPTISTSFFAKCLV